MSCIGLIEFARTKGARDKQLRKKRSKGYSNKNTDKENLDLLLKETEGNVKKGIPFTYKTWG